MSTWVWKGLKTGKMTTRYPDEPEKAAGVSPGLPDISGTLPPGICPVPLGSVTNKGERNIRDCVHCLRCIRSNGGSNAWRQGYEWARMTEQKNNGNQRLGAAFSHSIHIRVLDAGACGACLSEIKQTGKPHYNIHRLGFFITPTPRQADILLVVGPVSDNMVSQLIKTYEAMPTPKMVVAAGTCALTGGVFGPGFSCRSGVADIIPVDVEVPGCPPPPLAFIHALLVAAGRMPSCSVLPEKNTRKKE